MADRNLMNVQKNRPVLSEIIFRTKVKTFLVSGFTELIIR